MLTMLNFTPGELSSLSQEEAEELKGAPRWKGTPIREAVFMYLLSLWTWYLLEAKKGMRTREWARLSDLKDRKGGAS